MLLAWYNLTTMEKSDSVPVGMYPREIYHWQQPDFETTTNPPIVRRRYEIVQDAAIETTLAAIAGHLAVEGDAAHTLLEEPFPSTIDESRTSTRQTRTA